MNRARIIATIAVLTTGGNAIAVAAGTTAVIGVLSFDDPWLWVAAGVGIGAAHYSIKTVERGLAILNGIAGVGISAFVSPWIVAVLKVPFEGSHYPPLSAYAVLFLVAWGWGWVFRKVEPVASAWFGAAQAAGIKLIKQLGGR
jgi:hypothetical protein